jgi:hypothetical protein
MVEYQKSQIKKLTRPVQEFMIRQFNLPIEYLDVLRCLEIGEAAKRKGFCVFSPAKAREYRLTIRTRADLGKHPEMILFKGYIDREGTIKINDRRRAIWERQTKIKKQPGNK